MEEVTWEPVTWYVGAVKMKPRKGKSIRLNLGYCTVGEGIAFISTDILHVLVIRSVDIHRVGDRTSCGDAKWCFNLKCPLNKAVVEKFKSHGISTREELERFHQFLERCIEELKAIYGAQMFEKKGGAVFFEKGAPLEVIWEG